MTKQNSKTTERKAAEAILGGSKETITIDGNTWQLGKPSVATIIMCSALVSELPDFKQIISEPQTEEDYQRHILLVLKEAKDMKVLGKVLSVLILGAKRVKEHRRVTIGSVPRKARHGLLNRLFGKASDKDTSVEEVDYLAEQILLEFTPIEMAHIISTRLIAQDIEGFFVLTTSLKNDGNLLTPTKSGKSASEVDD